VKKLVIVVVSGLLVACSAQYTTNGEQKYLESRNGERLVVPSPLSRANISDFYDLPAQTQNAKASIIPPK
jgi:uncharacterized lipoprotein